jgi:hypothetical protein
LEFRNQIGNVFPVETTGERFGGQFYKPDIRGTDGLEQRIRNDNLGLCHSLLNLLLGLQQKIFASQNPGIAFGGT